MNKKKEFFGEWVKGCGMLAANTIFSVLSKFRQHQVFPIMVIQFLWQIYWHEHITHIESQELSYWILLLKVLSSFLPLTIC